MTLTYTNHRPDEVEAPKTHKRKGDFKETNHVPVVVVNCNEENGDRLEAIKQQLRNRRNQYLSEATGTDPLLNTLKAIGNDDRQILQAMIKKSQEIQADLDNQIQKEMDAFQQESSVLAQVSMSVQRLEQNRDKLLKDIDEIDQRQIQLQHQIALHQQDTAQEIEYLDNVDEQRKREVPRLKHAISLYASTTGIKWDFSKDDILSGSVVCPFTCCPAKYVIIILLTPSFNCK